MWYVIRDAPLKLHSLRCPADVCYNRLSNTNEALESDIFSGLEPFIRYGGVWPLVIAGIFQ